MAKKLYVLSLGLILVGLASVGFAQMPTGTILGVVKDSSGGVVPGAAVTVRNTETAMTRTITTGDEGAYRIPALPVGHYTVKIEKEGFQTVTQTDLTLELAQDLVVNSSLQVGTSSQEVTVAGEAPVVNTTSGSLGSLVNEERVADLPLNGRNWVDLTLMQPGISQYTGYSTNSPIAVVGTYFSSNGAPVRSNNYMLDGAITNNITGATAASVSNSSLGVEGIREYKVETNSFSAEYGMYMGSQTTVVTKSGTNAFHGSAFEFLRNSALDARNFFDSPVGSGTTLSGQQRRLPPFVRNNFGGAVGGPIQKNKTFFFATFEGVQERKGLTLLGTGIPTSAWATAKPLIAPFQAILPPPTPGLPNNQYTFPYDRPVSEQYGQIRLDHTFSTSDTAFARYTIDLASVVQPNLALPNPYFADHLHSAEQFTTVSENHVFSPNLLGTARFSLSRTPLENADPTPAYPCAFGPCSFVPGFPQYGMGAVTVGGTTGFSAGLQAHHDQKIYAGSYDLFYTKGRHSLKFGTLVTNWKMREELQASLRGTVAFSSIANLMSATYTSYTANAPGSNVARNNTVGSDGYYLQDDIRVNSRFTVNAGLRYEFLLPNYHEVNGLQSNLRNYLTDTQVTLGPQMRNPSLRDFSPRLGFAWDVMGDGKTSVRGGGAILYDLINQGPNLYRVAGNEPPYSPVTLVTTPATVPLTIPFTYPAANTGTTLVINDYNYKQPALFAYNLTVERQLPWGVGLSVGYAGSRGTHLMNIKEGNNCIPTGFANGVYNWVNAANLPCPLGRANHANNPAFTPAWGTIQVNCSCSDSWYNSMQVVATKRLSHGFQFQANYTWSRVLDDGQGEGPSDNATATTAVAQPFIDKGLASFDSAHNIRVNFIYILPKVSSGRFVGGLVNGWWVSSIIAWQTGYPFTPLLNLNRSESGVLSTNPDRPNIDPSRSISSITSGTSPGCGTAASNTKAIAPGTPLGTPTLWYDPCAFSVQAAGFLGTSSRNFLRGPHMSNVNFSLVKDTPLKYLGEAGKLEFRAEIFNLFNHASFSLPNGTVYAGATPTDSPLTNAGVITSTVTTPRNVQLALKLLF